MSGGLNILLVDDEPTIRLIVGDVLRAAGHQIRTAADGAEALELVSTAVFDVVITDMRLPKADGMTVFRAVREQSPDTDVILITAFGDVEDAVTALKEGAVDYLTKPFDNDEIVLRLGRIANRRSIERELKDARAVLVERSPENLIVGRSPPMVRLRQRIETIARSDAAVIITGESGTGKELVARALHALSSRRDKPLIAVNCAAFPETLLEAELFGHEKGAYTGATRARDGRFKAADGGVLLLDEIAEIPLTAQAKLLRVLQDGAIEPLGTHHSIQVDVRVISATHQNLKERIGSKQFREDLYYRLNVLDIHVPSLRERRGDLPLLVELFLKRFSRNDEARPAISPRAWAALSEYSFPGNVRELEHAMQHAVVLAAGKEIDLEHLPADIAGPAQYGHDTGQAGLRPLAIAGKEFEREYLLRALNLSGGKRAQAAQLLGISRKNLWEKLRAHGITDSDLD